MSEINTVTSYTCSECWMNVESFHEFYRTTELIHKKRSYNDTDDAEQLNPLYECDANDEPEYKTILIPTPIVVVERLPEIFEDINNDEIATAENILQEDACLPKRSSSTKSDRSCSKKRKKSRSKSLKRSSKIVEKKSSKIIRTIDKIV